MDFESSSKFISSLAKFLQSLCNGYVEFNNGVEVIGHIYLNVDTGKKIDYILNEKVCKTDENSVTFISNSFHAQPAEKPKPPAKTGPTSDPIKPADNDIKTDEDVIIMEETESQNIGAAAQRDSFQHVNTSSLGKPNRPSKRPFGISFSSSHRHSAKQSRPDPSSGSNGAPVDTDSLHSENSSSNFLPPQLAVDGAITAATESDISHLSKVFPQTFNSPVNSLSASEDRDVKPQLDSDLKVIQVTQVKQEYDPSGHGGEDDSEIFDDSQDHSNAFPGMPYDQYYGEGSKRGQRSDYSQVGSMVQGEFFPAGVGSSLDASGGDSSEGARYAFHIRSGNQRLTGDTSSSFPALNRDAHVLSSPRHDKTLHHTCWCYYCDKGFDSELLLVEHLSVHTMKKPFRCEKCSLSFMHRSTLKRHQNVCGGSYTLKKHVCPFCERSFTYRHDLRRHCKNIHISEPVS